MGWNFDKEGRAVGKRFYAFKTAVLFPLRGRISFYLSTKRIAMYLANDSCYFDALINCLRGVDKMMNITSDRNTCCILSS